MVNFFLFKLCALTAMSGFLFGYDTGIVSGSMIFIKDEMALTNFWIELFVSITILFAWISAWCTISINDRIGRKTLILVASGLFTLASIIMGLAPEKYTLLFGRAVAGCGIGLGSMIAPIYIAELAPKENRGSLVTFNSAFVTFGILASTLIASAFSYLPSHIGWRLMLSFAGIPSLIQMIGFFFMPESPRYLVLKGKEKEALDVMIKICKNDIDKAREEIRSIKTSFEEHQTNSNGDSNGYSNNKNGLCDSNNNGFANIELKKSNENSVKKPEESYITKLINIFKDKSTRHCLLIGICLHLGQQLSAINTIMYYGAMLIQMSGILSKRVAIWFTVVVGITNATTSFLALFIYDKVTRRKVTLWSMSGIVICLALMGSVFMKVDNSVLEIKDLNDTYAENLDLINYCRRINTCGKCVTDPRCGFCFNSADIENTARCLPRSSDPLKSLNNTYCAAGSNEDLDIYFSTPKCPSEWGVVVLVTLCAFLVSYAPGMGATPWSINAEIYPMWCRGVAVSFATGFNWLFNLLVSISFLTITEYFQVSGAFFLYCSVSAILTIIYYIWLPETKHKSLEQDALVFHH